MTYNELIKKMQNQVARYVKHYKSDFDYDIEYLGDHKDIKTENYIWYVRELGTQLTTEANTDYIAAVERNWNQWKKYKIVKHGSDYKMQLLENRF